MHRFFVPAETMQSKAVLLAGDLAHQLSRVLRLRAGDQIELLDNSGRAWLARLDEVSPRCCRATTLACYRPSTECRTRFVLYQGLPRGHKFDLILQKATELGASRIVPVRAARSIQMAAEEATPARARRWERIIQEAAEQSGRALMPALSEAISLPAAIDEIEEGDLCLAGAPREGATPIRHVLGRIPQAPTPVRLFVGPEGGLDDAELGSLQAAGVSLVSLGPRVLRTETAGLVMLALASYALGEMELPGEHGF